MKRTLCCLIAALFAFSPLYAQEKARLQTLDFEEDKDFNQQPDFWSRYYSSEFPTYLDAMLTDATAHTGAHSLMFIQNGGNISYRSPQLPVSSQRDYELEAWIKTEGLAKSTARVRIIWLNAFKRELETSSTQPVRGTADWTRVSLFAESLPTAASFAVIECLLEGKDIRGRAWFDSIQLAEHPKLSLAMGAVGNLIPPGLPRILQVGLTGLSATPSRISVRLEDFGGKPIWDRTEFIRPATDSCEFVWRLPPELTGYFTAVGSLAAEDSLPLERRFPVVLPPPLEYGPAQHPPVLGLDLPAPWFRYGDKGPLLRTLAVAVRVNLAAPEEDESREIDSMLRSPNAVSYAVGVLPIPLTEGDYEAAVKDVVIRYADLISAWQIGSGDEEMSPKANVVKAFGLLRELTYPDPIGMPESMAQALAGNVEPDFIVLRPAPDSSPTDISSMVSEAKRSWKSVWVEMNPPEPSSSLDDVERLAMSALGGVAAGVDRMILLPRGLTPALFDDQSFPEPSYLVWRNLNALLSGSSPAGTLRLPGGSDNMVLRKDHDFLLACWRSASNAAEPVNLGPSVRFWDAFGNELPFPRLGEKSNLYVGRLPVFATDVDQTVMEMTLSASALADKLYMQGGPQRQGLSVANRLGDNLECVLDLRYPAGFVPEHRRFVFDLAPDQTYVAEAPVALPMDIVPGKHMLHAQLNVSGRGLRQLEILKEFEVVSEIETKAEVHKSAGFVEISLEVTNASPVALNLMGTAGLPGELPLQSLPASVEPGGRLVRTYRFPLEQVAGRTVRLAVRELNGPRFVNEFVHVQD